MRHVASVAAVCALAVVAAGSHVETRADTPLQSAALAWDRGDYPRALTTYLQILDGAPDDAAVEAIALQTGELFQSTELTTDGTVPQFSPDGRYLTYEAGAAPSRVVRLLEVTGGSKPVAELQGSGAVFSPDGSRLAYLRLTPSAELLQAYAEIEHAPPSERLQRTSAAAERAATEAQLVVREIPTGTETVIDTGGLRKSALAFGAGNTILFAGGPRNAPQQVYSAAEDRSPIALTAGEGDKIPGQVNAPGTAAIVTPRIAFGGRGGGAGSQVPASFIVVSLPDGKVATVTGSAPAFSADGRTLTWVARDGQTSRLMAAPVADVSASSVIRQGPERIDAPALSPDGSRIAFQLMPKEDWEIYVINRDGTGETRVTREIQHDLLPRFLSSDRLLAVMGEPRHRRSYLYDLSTLQRTRLFHNNTVRTIAPEYSWMPDAQGLHILISAERDGDTVSPQRGVYLMDLSRKVTRPELRARVAASLADEQALRAKGKRLFAPIATSVKAVTSEASVARVYGYEKALFDFDSKHITRRGNKLAAAYLMETYRSFGYEPQYQWFEAANAIDGQTANVIATLKGTVNPELVYVVSSHYDSVAVGPGADDDSSGTAALLETARILAGHPQPATIVFASFTGEEAGLLGSREFVRRAVADKLQIVGALNNDMIGWANDHRLDDTIRYSNPGIRDIQHNAAMMFSNLITYDALYYKSTDAAAYYEAYGDIVGGIGSYPVLGNPHYHQAHDVLETINHQLVTEVARTTAATLMLLASTPSRLTGLTLDGYANGTATVSWKPAPESGIIGYIVAYGPPERPDAKQVRTSKPSAVLTGVPAGAVVSVKAVSANGAEGWDWARVTVRPGNVRTGSK